MTYAIGIVAHPTRFEQAHQLAAAVDAHVLVLDEDSQGEQWCHQQVLTELTKRDADWYVLLEDDALPCEDFHEHLDAALADADESLVSLYLGTGAWADTNQASAARLIPILTNEADADGAHWITSSTLWHAVGVAIPARRAKSALNYMRGSHHATDKALSRWARGHHLPVRYTWPSLVDHADGERLVGGQRDTLRRAWWVSGHPRQAEHTTA